MANSMNEISECGWKDDDKKYILHGAVPLGRFAAKSFGFRQEK